MATLSNNIARAIRDFDSIETAIEEKGVEVPKGTPTSSYDQKIKEIEQGITPTGTINITENGNDIDVTQYATADVNVPQDITVYEQYTVEDNTLIGANIALNGEISATIPTGVAEIGQYAFSRNPIITNVSIPDSVMNIGYRAFGDCEKLETVIMGNNVTTISNSAFENCRSIDNIVIPDSVTSIGGNAFSGCTKLNSITISKNVNYIGDNVFTWCTSLSSITVNPENTIFSSGDGCNAVIDKRNNQLIIGCKTTIIPDYVTRIKSYAFGGCTELKSIMIPDSVTSVGYGVFNGCANLTDVYYTGTEEQWQSITGISDAGIPQSTTIHYNYTPE